MPFILIQLRDGIEEKRLMEHLTCIIEGDCFRDQFPQIIKNVSPRTWRLDLQENCLASLTRRGERGWNNGSPVENDILMVSHRHGPDVLEALRPWLEYQFGRREMD
jgi:hypothetical protein